MQKRTVTFGMLVLLGTATLILAQAKTATERFEEGRKAELTLPLEKVVQIYDSIPGDFPNERSTGAKGVVRIITLYAALDQPGKVLEYCQKLRGLYGNLPEVIGEVSSRCADAAPPPRTNPGIFIAEMDPATGTIRGPVRSLTPNSSSDEGAPMFSPDGRLLALRKAGAAPAATGRGRGNTNNAPATVVVRSLDGGTERSIGTCDASTVGISRSFWLPDSKNLLISLGGNPLGCMAQSNVETGTRAAQYLQTVNLPGSNGSILSVDGLTLYSIAPVLINSGATTAIATTLVASDLNGKIKRAIALPVLEGARYDGNAINYYHSVNISPDGHTLAIIRRQDATDARVARFEIDGGDLRYLELVSGIGSIHDVSWSKDGRRILFGRFAGGGKWQIMQVPANGGAPTCTGLEVTGLRYFDLNRDNTQIAFDGLANTVSPPDNCKLAPAASAVPRGGN